METKTSGVTAYNPDLQELEQSSTSSSVFNTRTINKKNIFDNLKSRFRNSLFSFAYSDEYVIDLQQKYEDSLIYLNVLSFHRGSIRINKTVPDEIAEIIRESFIETYENLKEVQTIGGHARAIGITFDKQFSMEDVNKIIIEETGKLLKELKDKIQ